LGECRCISFDEYLLATDLKNFVLTTEHYFSRGNLTEFQKRYHSQVMGFWRNTEIYSQKSSKNGVLLPKQKISLSDLKQNTLFLEYLYSPIKRELHSWSRYDNDAATNPALEHLLVTDGANYLITNRYFFIAPEGSKEGVRLFWSDFCYSRRKSFISKSSKIVLRPVHGKWEGEYVIPTDFSVSASLFYSKVHNWDERLQEIEEAKKRQQVADQKYQELQAQRRAEEKKVVQRKEYEACRQQEELRKQQQQRVDTLRIQKEKTAHTNMPPPEFCNACGEFDWVLKETSPNMRSAIWECQYCGKSVRILSQELKPTTTQRSSIPKYVQREVWRRDHGCCVECGSKENIEFDHIIPVSKGGANTARNIQLLCQECNRKKGASDPGDF
jgi:hypothetical protein